MNKRFRIYTFLLLTIITTFGISAQSPFGRMGDSQKSNPIHWNATAKMVSATEGYITITADIASTWHLYGMSMPENGPKPTRFVFDQPEGVILTGHLSVDKAPVKKVDSMFNAEVTYWEGKVVFKQNFRISDNVDISALRLKCSVEYMGCNDATCLPPARKKFDLKVICK